MDENTNNQAGGPPGAAGNPMPQAGSPQPPQPPQANTGGQFGAPPSPSLNIRTADSDVSSIERGDAKPTPESVMPGNDSNEPIFRPETQIGDAGDGGGDAEGASGGSKKKMWTWIIIAVVVIVLGVGGYILYPILFPSSDVVPPPPATAPPPASVAIHQSLFLVPAQTRTDIILPDLLHSTIVTNLQNAAAFSYANGTVQEVVVLDAGGGQVPFSQYFNAFAPALSVAELATWFEDDFTAFMYYDENGIWPGLAAKIKNGVNIDDARTALAALEGMDLNSFYLVSQPAFGEFADGTIGSSATRYAVGTDAGASFNYGVTDSYLVVSTSFNGLKAVGPLLGL